MESPETYRVDGRDIRLTHLDKVFWPNGTTKGDVLAYYMAVAPAMLPYIEGRPLSFTRWPDGVQGKSFYQKNPPSGTPEWIPTSLEHKTRHLLVNDRATLAFLVQLGVIEVHMPLSRADDMEHPDFAVIDLDPTPPAGFEEARRVAMVVREALDHLGLRGYPKFSGETGIHIFLPIHRDLTSREVEAAMRRLGKVAALALPDLVTLERRVARRSGVYFDYGQNAPTRTMAAPYSLRPNENAAVSCPVTWDEVHLAWPQGFTIRSVPRRLAMGNDAWAGIFAHPQDITRLEELRLQHI